MTDGYIQDVIRRWEMEFCNQKSEELHVHQFYTERGSGGQITGEDTVRGPPGDVSRKRAEASSPTTKLAHIRNSQH